MTSPKKKRTVTSLRPFWDSAVHFFGQWIINHNWKDAVDDESASVPVEKFLTEITNAYQLHFSLVTSTGQVKDKPWMTHRIKQLLKQCQHAYASGDMSKWRSLHTWMKEEISSFLHAAQQNTTIYTGTLCSIWNLVNLEIGTGKFNILCHFKPKSTLIPGVDIDSLATSEAINHHFANICNQLPALKLQNLPSYLPTELPHSTIYSGQVLKALKGLKPTFCC